jgi:hypothetical protein
MRNRLVQFTFGKKEGALESVRTEKKQQVPPLRCAPVGMTLLFRVRDFGTQTEVSSQRGRIREKLVEGVTIGGPGSL